MASCGESMTTHRFQLSHGRNPPHSLHFLFLPDLLCTNPVPLHASHSLCSLILVPKSILAMTMGTMANNAPAVACACKLSCDGGSAHIFLPPITFFFTRIIPVCCPCCLLRASVPFTILTILILILILTCLSLAKPPPRTLLLLSNASKSSNRERKMTYSKSSNRERKMSYSKSSKRIVGRMSSGRTC